MKTVQHKRRNNAAASVPGDQPSTTSRRIWRTRRLIQYLALLFGIVLPFSSASAAAAAPVFYKYATVDGLKLFYRESGEASKPTIVLLHGFPSSSFEFHDLIPRLSERFHVLAPDYPGMGYSQVPMSGDLAPSFDNLAAVIGHLLVQLGQSHVILYMHDFGGPVGMRLAVSRHELIDGLVFQNTTITLSGYNPARLKVFERIGGKETPEKLAEAEESASERRDEFLHRTGAHDASALDPDDWGADAYAFGIPECRQYMSRLLMDIMSNAKHYAEWGAYLKSEQPKTLIVWGKNDPVFLPGSAQDIKADVPSAKLYYYDGGHFVLDEFSGEIASRIIQVFAP
jgi:pimeloyl-ACP methyl ester carboxylesterase